MGCPSEVKLNESFVFTVCTHDPDTGVLTDADAVPAYRIYEDETGTAILNDNMAKLDDDNTTGFYSEQIAATAANGFEVGKYYSIYISATVDSDTGGKSYTFRCGEPSHMLIQGVAQGGTTTTVQLASGAVSSDDEFNGDYIVVYDVNDSYAKALRKITDTVNSTDTVTVATLPFTPAASDPYVILAADTVNANVTQVLGSAAVATSDTYHGNITSLHSGSSDYITAAWSLNGDPLDDTDAITGCAITVVKVSDNSTLIDDEAMTEVQDGLWRYTATGAEALTANTPYIAKVSATIGGETREIPWKAIGYTS
jgi:hypothetical protein